MPSILHRWKRAGYTPADIRGMYVAGQILKGNIGPQMEALLSRYGLEDMTRWVADAIINNKSQEQIMLEIYDQPEFRKRFPAIVGRENAGLSPISVEEYLSYEQAAESLGSTWGLRLTKEEVDQLLIHDVSAHELEQRFNIAATAMYSSAPETRAELQRLFNIGPDHLMRYWMNPKKEIGNLQNQYRMGEIAGAALRVGYGQVQMADAHRLLEAGFDESAAMEGFATLSQIGALFRPLAHGESVVSRETQLDFLTGDVETARMIERTARERLARFSGAGGFGTGGEGFTTGTTAGLR